MEMKSLFYDGGTTVITQTPIRGLAQPPASGFTRMKVGTHAGSAASMSKPLECDSNHSS